jgi:hypothetical protein
VLPEHDARVVGTPDERREMRTRRCRERMIAELQVEWKVAS